MLYDIPSFDTTLPCLHPSTYKTLYNFKKGANAVTIYFTSKKSKHQVPCVSALGIGIAIQDGWGKYVSEFFFSSSYQTFPLGLLRI